MTWQPHELPGGGYVILKGSVAFNRVVTGGGSEDRRLVASTLAELLNDHLDEDDVDGATITALLTWLNNDRNYYLVEQCNPAQLAALFMAQVEHKEEKLEAARVAAYVKRGEGDGCWYCGSPDHKTDECPDFRHNLVHPIEETQGRNPENAHH